MILLKFGKLEVGMKIKVLEVGVLKANCYIVIKDKQCLIIDPGDEALKIIDACKDYQVRGILVTHHHFDHVGALNDIEEYYKLKHNTFSYGFNYEIIKTPGHSKDSLTFYFKDDKVMFTGDFLFYHSIGRYDFEDSSIEDMKESLKLILKYNDDIKIYPGHGRETFLGEEKINFQYYFN